MKKSLAYFTALLISLSLACSAVAGELLSNEDFEIAYLSSWYKDGDPEYSGALCTDTAARGSGHGAWIYTQGGSSAEAYSCIYQDISAGPGDLFFAAAYIRTPEPGPWVDWVDGSYACVRISFMSDPATVIASYDSAHLTTADTPYADPYTVTTPEAPVGTTIARFICYLYEPEEPPIGHGQSVANFDDCSMIRRLVTVVSPAEGTVVSSGLIPVTGLVHDASIETIDLNGNIIECYEGTWQANISVTPGENTIIATAFLPPDNFDMDETTITCDPGAATGLFDIIYPENGAVYYAKPALVTASLSDPRDLYININGKEYKAEEGALIAEVPVTSGGNVLEFRCRDRVSGSEETQYVSISFDATGIDFGGVIANSGFENSGYPQRCWKRWSGNQSFEWDDGSASFIATAAAHSGSQSSGQVLYGGADRWGGIRQEFAVAPGDTINASGYVASFTGDDPLTEGAEAWVEIKYLSNRGNEIEKYMSDKITAATNGWVQLSVSSVVPDGAETAVFSFCQVGRDGATGKVYFDDAYAEVIAGGYSPEQGDPFEKPQSNGPVQVSGNTLLVNSQPFKIRGTAYQPVPIGYDVGEYDIYNAPAIYNRDLPLLRAMNVNAIRTYGRVTSTAFLDACYNGGADSIYVVMGYYIDGSSDLNNPAVRNWIKADFQNYVSEFKNHPAVLMWSPGNETEWAYEGKDSDLYTLLNELAEAAYIEEGASYHPVTAALMDIDDIGDNGLLTTDEYMDYLDVWGANVYRGMTFGDMFDDIAHRTEKPFWVSECGVDAYYVTEYHFDGDRHVADAGYVNDEAQAEWAAYMMLEVLSSDVAAGGMIFEYADEWWKAAGGLSTHDISGALKDPRDEKERQKLPDGFQNEEYWGVVSISPDGTDPDTVDDVTPRPVYYSIGDIFGNVPFSVVQSGESIQAVIDDPASGNVIYVREGFYDVGGAIEISGGKTLIGAGAASETVISGRVLFKESEGEINNFTILYPEGEYLEFQNDEYPGGIDIMNDAGVLMINSGAEVKNCVIMPDLDGINARGEYDPPLTVYGKGLQIYNFYNSPDIDPNIANNLILNAHTGICLFSHASGGALGGYIRNNTLDNNRYGIMERMHREDPVIQSNIITGSADAIHLTYEDGALLTVRLSHIINNDLWGNTNSVWCDATQSPQTPTGPGNISEDPFYNDPPDDYTPLNPGCADKGYRRDTLF